MQYFKTTAVAILLAALVSPLAYSEGLPRSQSAEGAAVYFISPQDGDTVSSPVHVVFGLAGMGVAPAGIEVKNTGHHHLLIDVDEIAFDTPVMLDDQHLHFGKGETEAMVELTPGEHSLQLLLADHYHMPHQPAVMSEKIKITVK